MTKLQSLYLKYISIMVAYIQTGSQGTSFQRNMNVWVCHNDVVDGHRWRAEDQKDLQNTEYRRQNIEDRRQNTGDQIPKTKHLTPNA